MAETAGLALGAISLGIQVCKGIITFADTVRSKTDDLISLDQKARTLADTLDLVSKTLQRIQPTVTNANSTTAVSLVAAIGRSTKSCESSLEELERFVTKYSGCSVSSLTFKRKCSKVFKTFKYGFNQREVAEMEDKLASVNSTLLVGLQSLDLDLAAEHYSQLNLTRQDLTNLSTSISTQQQEWSITQHATERTLKKLEIMEGDIYKLGGSLNALLSVGLPALHDDIIGTSAAVVASLDSLHDYVSNNSSGIVDRLDGLASTIEGRQSEQTAIITTEISAFTQKMDTYTETLAALTARFGAVPAIRKDLPPSIQRFATRPSESSVMPWTVCKN